MKPIASAILSAVACLNVQESPILAQSAAPGVQPQTSNAAALPEFVPSTGQTKYTLAVQENKSPSAAAREAAEALSAKFAGMATGSISKSDETVADASPATPVEHAPQPLLATPVQRAAQPTEGRAIVIASNQSPDDPSPKKSAGDAAKVSESARKIPRTAVTKETRAHFRGATRANLAAVGEKVSFLDKLTNPALWH
jgi:hypothetical protein